MSTASPSTASSTPPPASDTCAICLVDLPSPSSSPSPDDAACWLEPCCHRYHYACLLRWAAAARPPRCPLCAVGAVAALVPVGGGRHVRHALAVGGEGDVTPLPAGVRRRAAALAAGDAPGVDAPAATLAARAARQAAHDWIARDLAALSGGIDAGIAALAVAAAATTAREGDATAWRAAVAAAAQPFVGDSCVAASLAAWAAAFVTSGMSVAAWDRVHGGGGGSDDDHPRRLPTARASSLSPSSMGRADSLASDGSDAYGGAVEAAWRG